MRRSTLLALLLALALATAGCLAGGGDGELDAQSDDDPTPTTPAADEGDDGNETNDTEPAFAWTHDLREGTVNGVGLGAVGLYLAPTTDSPASETWDVAEGTQELTLNLSSEDGDLFARIYPPCEDCENPPVETEDGEASWNREDPEVGTWEVLIYRGGTGAGELPYELGIGQLVPTDT